MDYFEQLDTNGFFVIERALSEALATELLGYVIKSFSGAEHDYILASDFRVHAPLKLTSLVNGAVHEIVTPAHAAVSKFLGDSNRMVELSSITVFPHADAQPIHADEQNEGETLISIFVNLAPTKRESGALSIIPGSHKFLDRDFSGEPFDVLELPTGSAVFMNSKTWHGGGANQTSDRIRPVFYMSFGKPDLEGPTYSIRKDVFDLGNILSDFNGPSEYTPIATWTKDVKPRIPDRKSIVTTLGDGTLQFILLADGKVVHHFRPEAEIEKLKTMFSLIIEQPGQNSISDIGGVVGVDPDDLLPFFRSFAADGWFIG